MNAGQLAKALGGAVIGPNKVLAPGPGHSKHDRSLSILLSPSAPDGFCVHSFAGDSIPGCRDYVKAALGMEWHRPDVPRPLRSPKAADAQPPESEYWKHVWHESRPIPGTIVETYLASRSLTFTHELNGVLRFHPALSFGGGFVPGMLALFRSITTNKPVGIQRTFLTASGEQIDRWMLGPSRGAAIKLDADEHVTGGLFVGEGCETCMAARLAGLKPCWALGCEGGIKTFPVLAGIEALSLLAETDDKGANARAVKQCAERWSDAGREVGILEPIGCGDMNNVWEAAL